MPDALPTRTSFADYVKHVEARATPWELEQLEEMRAYFKAEAERLKDDGEDNPRVPA